MKQTESIDGNSQPFRMKIFFFSESKAFLVLSLFVVVMSMCVYVASMIVHLFNCCFCFSLDCVLFVVISLFVNVEFRVPSDNSFVSQ